jgi:cobalt-zinc-cadmium efflux system membrane fusion protein
MTLSMLVDPKTTIPGQQSQPGEPDHIEAGSARRTPSGSRSVMYLVVALLAVAAAYRFYDGPVGHPEAQVKALPLMRSGEAITVPEGSGFRDRLVIAPVAEKDISRELVLPAVVEADPAHLIKVAPPLAGRITQLKVTLGERVKAGQPLVVIDSPDLAQAYSDYDRAKALLALALKNRDRQRGMVKFGGAAEKDMQQAETDYITAEAEDQRATTHLKQIGVDPDAANKSHTVTVVAPMDGSVIDLAVAPGQYWNDATAALMTIADLSSVWVTASVPEKDIRLISTGQAVEVGFAAYPGVVLKGTVLFVSDVLDADTRRTKVRIAFDNSDRRLRPGMFAT